jgi:Cu/Ag efflux protein CusF
MRRKITFTMWALLAIVAVALTIRVTAEEPAPAPSGQMFIYSGILRSMDLHARTITVGGTAVPQTFTVPTDTEIIVKEKPRGSLSDLMVGDGIQVKYTDDDGVHVAHQISLLSLKAP